MLLKGTVAAEGVEVREARLGVGRQEIDHSLGSLLIGQSLPCLKPPLPPVN